MLKDFNEWGQIYVITLLKKYIPDSQDELFAIMVRRTILILTD